MIRFVNRILRGQGPRNRVPPAGQQIQVTANNASRVPAQATSANNTPLVVEAGVVSEVPRVEARAIITDSSSSQITGYWGSRHNSFNTFSGFENTEERTSAELIPTRKLSR